MDLRYITICRLLVSFLFSISISVLANNQIKLNIEQYKYNFKNFKHKGIQNTTTAIIQDKKGIIWIGTQNGVTKFDGYEIDYRRNDPLNEQSISSNYIKSFCVDLEDNVWVGTNYGLNVIESSTYKVIRAEKYAESLMQVQKAFINALHCDENGLIWIGTNNGLNIYNPENKSTTKYGAQQNDPLAFQESTIVDIVILNNNAFVLTEKAVYSVNDNFVITRIISIESVTDITAKFGSFHVNENFIYLGTTNRGLYIYNLESETIKTSPVGPKKNDIRDIVEDKNGTIWVASTNGLILINDDNSKGFQLTRKNHQFKGLDTDYLTSIFIDHEDVVWLGSHESGVYIYSPHNSKVATIPMLEGLTGRGARTVAMTKDSKENVWLAGKESLIQFEFERGYITSYEEPLAFKTSITYGLAFDKKREVIYSSTSSGITSFDINKKVFSRFLYFDEYKAGYGILVDNKDRLWVGGYSTEGISSIELSTGKLLNHIPSQKVFSFLELEEHILAFTINGLFFINKMDFSLVIHRPDFPNAISHNAVTGGLIDSKKRLWIATSGGLNLNIGKSYLENNYQHYTETDGFTSNVMTGPLEDNQGFLWVPTTNKLNRLSPENKEIITLGINEGAAENYYIGAYLKLESGNLLFNSGKTGITIIEPSFEFELPTDYTPFISHIYSNLDEITNKRQFTASVASSNYFAPEQMRYKYQLIGFDEQPIEVDSSRRVINYTNLPSGSYTLKVQTAAAGGHWSDPIDYPFHINPFYYERLEFKLILVFVMSTLIFGLFRLRVNVLKNRNKALEILVAERTLKIEQQKDILEKLAVTDQLTSLHNRHFLEGQIEPYLCQAKRNFREDSNSGVYAFIIDIDHFKKVNDELGHDAGDNILKNFAALLKATCRASDMVIRWGGEEFVIISSHNNRHGPCELAEKIRVATEQAKFFYDDINWINKTCSIGFCCFPTNKFNKDMEFKQILNFADEALYAMKVANRNAWLGIIDINMELEKKFDLKSTFNDMNTLRNNNNFTVKSSLFDDL